MDIENFVKLTEQEAVEFVEGRLTYINHPKKGIVYVDNINLYVNTIELTQEEKDAIK
jgi:hypothetical protein